MVKRRARLGVVAPSSRMNPAVAEAVRAVAEIAYPTAPPEIVFHPQCWLAAGHFAGSDLQRADAFVEVANDPSFDALWIGKGGYGSGRLAEMVLPRLNAAARDKAYLGYSDAAALLAPLYGAGFGQVAHGPMAQDVLREGGAAATVRALDWLVDRSPKALEPSVEGGALPTAAFNMAVLSSILGTPLQPDLAGHVLMLEEVGEYMYRIDRFLFHITSNPGVRQAAGIRLGRCSAIPPNDPDFGQTPEEAVRYWCARSGIPYLGPADIGHDVDNKIVPFGRI